MPRCHHYFMIPQELYSFDDEEKNNNNKKDEKEIYMVVIMMHVTLLLVSLRLNYSPPSHSEIFFLYKCRVILTFTILQTPNKSRKKCMQRILTLFYYTNVLFFCITQTNVQNYSFQNLLCR